MKQNSKIADKNKIRFNTNIKYKNNANFTYTSFVSIFILLLLKFDIIITINN